MTVLNFPLSLAVIGAAGVVGGPPWLVGTAIVLCATTAIPGVVDEGDLDARLVNVVPALGVALALALTVRAVRRDGAAFVDRAYGDALRIVLAVALLVLALPWLAAETGFYFPGDFFLGEEVPRDRDPKYTAVHYGFHHGFGGVLLALTALVLSRVPAGRALRAALSLMLAYGLANAVQDGWNEQLWKRYTVDWEIPSMFRPEVSWGWLAILVGAVAIYVAWFGRGPQPYSGR